MLSQIEASYPASFRAHDVATLRASLMAEESVVLIGMKRVGISNFIRFIRHHQIGQELLFSPLHAAVIYIDLHDLFEMTPYAFWILMLKRIVDWTQKEAPASLSQKAQQAFLESIQLKDTFITLDSIRTLLRSIVKEGWYPILVCARFDRLQNILTHELFANLQGLKDSTGKLSYILTSFRPLDHLVPTVCTPASLGVFLRHQYVKPLLPQDQEVVCASLLQRYGLTLPPAQRDLVLASTGGHVQFLHLAILSLLQLPEHGNLLSVSEVLQALSHDENIVLQSEELHASLTPQEQQDLRTPQTATAPYLLETGFIQHGTLFSSLFQTPGTSMQISAHIDLTKQEQRLYDALRHEPGTIVERYQIVEAVWPDQVELGVSDWAIDRLVARLRKKLKSRHDPWRIMTVVSRGYKLLPLA